MALEAGIARSSINPPLDIPSGMWMAQKHVRGQGLDMDLGATALVLRDGDLTLALIDLDLCFLTDDLAASIRKTVGETVGIAPERVLPFCSHTHAGPVHQPYYEGEGQDRVLTYVASLPHMIAGAAARAASQLQPVRVAAGTGWSDIGINRDLRIADGRVICGCNPDGFMDRDVGVLRIDTADHRPLACIVNYACHPTVLGPGNLLISPDFPGSTRTTVEQVTGATCFFLQGAAGNMGPIETFVPHREAAHRLGTRLGLEAARVFLTLDTRSVRRELANVIASGAQLAEYVDVPVNAPAQRLTIASGPADLPTRSPFAEVYETAPQRLAEARERLETLKKANAPEPELAFALQQAVRWKLRANRMQAYKGKKTLSVECHAIRLGDTAIVAIAGEPYAEISVAVKKGSPYPGRTLFGGYLGGDMMYIPSAEVFAWDPPPMQVDNSPYAPEAERMASEHLSALLASLK